MSLCSSVLVATRVDSQVSGIKDSYGRIGFECDEYKLIVSTGSIEYAWARFARRVKDDAKTYCDYRSSREGTLSLYIPYGERMGMNRLNTEAKCSEWKISIPSFSKLANINLLWN